MIMKHNIQLSESEIGEVIADVSSVVFESALGRLLLSLEEEELVKLEQYLAEEREPEKLVEHLLSTYPNLQQLIDEEAEVLENTAKELNS